MVEEDVREELLGSAELAVGSAGWGNKQRRLPSVRCSRRKMTVEKSHGPASLAGATTELLVQERRGDEALLLVRSDSSGQLIDYGKWWQSSDWRGAEQQGAWPNGGGDKAEWATASSVTSVAVVRGPSHVGWRRSASSALHAVSAATRNRGCAQDRATVRDGQTEMGR
jgi:hypothetical protein